MRAPDTLNKRITIGRCSSDATDTNTASGAAYVFNDDGLPKHPTDRLGHNARQRVHGAAGGKGATQVIGRLGKSSAIATNDTMGKVAAPAAKRIICRRGSCMMLPHELARLGAGCRRRQQRHYFGLRNFGMSSWQLDIEL